MHKFYSQLSEKDKQSYAAVEALKFGYGGQQYICEVLGRCPKFTKEHMSKNWVTERAKMLKKAG